jgi:hypothetical protein
VRTEGAEYRHQRQEVHRAEADIEIVFSNGELFVNGWGLWPARSRDQLRANADRVRVAGIHVAVGVHVN